MSQNDRVVLGDNTKTTLEKIDILVTRCLKIGLHWPTEDAVGHIISAGIAAGLEGGDRKEYYGRVSKFKQVLHKKRAGLTPACTLKNYPDSPMGLPTALQVSYDDDPAVAEVDWAAFQKAEASKTLRKGHLSITGSASSGASGSGLAVMPNAAGTQAFPGMQDPAWQQGLQMMGRMFMPFMNHVAAMQAQGQQQGGSDGINLQFFQQSPGGSSGARAGFESFTAWAGKSWVAAAAIVLAAATFATVAANTTCGSKHGGFAAAAGEARWRVPAGGFKLDFPDSAGGAR